jgi:hypothetical protein
MNDFPVLREKGNTPEKKEMKESQKGILQPKIERNFFNRVFPGAGLRIC